MDLYTMYIRATRDILALMAGAGLVIILQMAGWLNFVGALEPVSPPKISSRN